MTRTDTERYFLSKNKHDKILKTFILFHYKHPEVPGRALIQMMKDFKELSLKKLKHNKSKYIYLFNKYTILFSNTLSNLDNIIHDWVILKLQFVLNTYCVALALLQAFKSGVSLILLTLLATA